MKNIGFVVVDYSKYVTASIAECLSKKGFNEWCRAECLFRDGKPASLTECTRALIHDHCSNLSLKQYNYEEQQFYAVPTIQEAAQWLLDEHKVFIKVSPNINDKFCFYASIYRMDKESWEEILPSQMNEAEENCVAFDKPTEAWLYAIELCLKYLI